MGRYTSEMINQIISGCKIDGPVEFRIIIRKTFELLPDNIIDFCEENIHFFSLDQKLRAYTFPKRYIKKKWVIIIDSTELKKTTKEALRTLLHEIGHAYFKHKGNEEWDIVRSNREEKEADEFAKKYLSD